MECLEVAVATGEGDIATGLWEAAQHTEVPYAGRFAVDVDAANTSAAHSYDLVFLTVFAHQDLTGDVSCLLGKKEGWFTMERERDVARHGDLAEKGAKGFVVGLSGKGKFESRLWAHAIISFLAWWPIELICYGVWDNVLRVERYGSHGMIAQWKPILLPDLFTQ